MDSSAVSGGAQHDKQQHESKEEQKFTSHRQHKSTSVQEFSKDLGQVESGLSKIQTFRKIFENANLLRVPLHLINKFRPQVRGYKATECPDLRQCQQTGQNESQIREALAGEEFWQPIRHRKSGAKLGIFNLPKLSEGARNKA